MNGRTADKDSNGNVKCTSNLLKISGHAKLCATKIGTKTRICSVVPKVDLFPRGDLVRSILTWHYSRKKQYIEILVQA